MEDLQKQWKHLYAEVLPSMAREKDPKQKSWPVHVDHCFGRIVLDNAVGKDKPWMDVVKAPAIKNMTKDQIKAAVQLGEAIASGEENLEELNQRSLDLRGKAGPGKKRKAADDNKQPKQELSASNAGEEPDHKITRVKKPRTESANISTYFLPSPQSPRKSDSSKSEDKDDDAIQAAKQAAGVNMEVQFKRIADSKLTAFRKQTLSMLCQVPRGQYSTYSAMSDYITKHSHKTCARAVGNAMRNNPFAPEVPCHRILAADGSLGGFAGHWGEDGKFAKEKHALLAKEGVKFDSNGKVKGPPFRDFSIVNL